MKKRASVALMMFCLAVSGSISLACGDKFLVSSRGTRHERANLPREAAILIYNNPASELPKLFESISAEAVLRKVGYRPTIVGSATQLENALRQGSWDLIVAGTEDLRALSNRVSRENVPALLPVLFNPTSSQLKQIKMEYPVLLKAPVKSQAFLDVIGDALAQKPKSPVKSSAQPAKVTSD